MIEALGGAPSWLVGISLAVAALAWSIDKSGPELRKWVEMFRDKAK